MYFKATVISIIFSGQSGFLVLIKNWIRELSDLSWRPFHVWRHYSTILHSLAWIIHTHHPADHCNITTNTPPLHHHTSANTTTELTAIHCNFITNILLTTATLTKLTPQYLSKHHNGNAYWLLQHCHKYTTNTTTPLHYRQTASRSTILPYWRYTTTQHPSPPHHHNIVTIHHHTTALIVHTAPYRNQDTISHH